MSEERSESFPLRVKNTPAETSRVAAVTVSNDLVARPDSISLDKFTGGKQTANDGIYLATTVYSWLL